MTIQIDSTAGMFPDAWVTIILCVDENTCTGSSRTSVTYLPDAIDDSQYDFLVVDNGTQVEINLSCYDVLQFVIN